MFEKEIKFIYDFNLNKLNKFGSFFSFAQLKESDIHPAILHYISAEMDYLIFEDRQKLVRDSIFDYSGEKVAGYFSLINEELKKSKRLSSDYVAKIMLHSISFNVNFLVRPKWALAKFIYEEESHRTGAEIKQILNYVYFYKYLRKIITSYINNKKVISLNSVEFAELLKNIDEATIQANYRGMISASLDAMADFFNIGGVHRTRVPFNAVQIFLEDKGLDAPLMRMREEFSDDPNNRIEINDLKNLLSSVLVKRVEVDQEPEFEERVIERESNPIQPSFIKEEEEAEKRYQTEIADEPYESASGEEIPEAELHEEEPIEEDEPERFEIKETRRETKYDFGEPETNFLENIINRNKQQRNSDELINEMEGLIEEENLSEQEKEMIVDEDRENYEDWVFVEEGEHKGLIKEIADSADTEVEVKKPKHGKKKNPPAEKEEPTLFEEPKTMSFGDVLAEEEEALQNSQSAVKKYDDSHNDFTKLLEHKNMSKIIDTVFDCDIEEVELMLNSISFFSTYGEAERFIDTYFQKMGIKPESDEAVTFKEIIKENYTK